MSVGFTVAIMLMGVAVSSSDALSQDQSFENYVNTYEKAGFLIVESNGVPDHAMAHDYDTHSVKKISPHTYSFRISLSPQKRDIKIPVSGHFFGVALNGVPIHAGSGEYWNNTNDPRWEIEPVVDTADALGVDDNNGILHDGQRYMYHGIPHDLAKTQIERQKSDDVVHVGYSADGFKIYVSRLASYNSSYDIQFGMRDAETGPSGIYDGRYAGDYVYKRGSGNLDECNGRFINGEYAYVLTYTFPQVPRCFRSLPDPSFSLHQNRLGGFEPLHGGKGQSIGNLMHRFK